MLLDESLFIHAISYSYLSVKHLQKLVLVPWSTFHRERSSIIKGSPSPSSLPPAQTKYPNTWATVLSTPEGKKLVIETKTLNALITSSLRVDSPHPASVGATIVHFDLPANSVDSTHIFLDTQSIEKANEIAKNAGAKMINTFDLLGQIRQLRSSFFAQSTYLLCRASGDITNDILCRPTTIYTLADVDSGEANSASKIASQLFQSIATCFLSDKPVKTEKAEVSQLAAECPKSIIIDHMTSVINLMEGEAIGIL